MSASRWTPTKGQRIALRADAPYVLVAASAGTGKTRTLVEKVLQVVRAGTPIEQLAVITFTHKAADELRQKLFEAFQEDPNLRPHRLALSQACISTIDTFCSRLLHERGLTIPIDPAFRVLAAPDDDAALADVLDRLFHHWYLGRTEGSRGAASTWTDAPVHGSRDHREFLRLIDLCSYRQGRELLKDEIVRLVKLARIHPEPEAFLAQLEAGVEGDRPAYVRAFAHELDQTWRTGVAAYREVIHWGEESGREKNFAKHRELLAALESAPWPQNEEALARDLPGALESVRTHLVQSGHAAAVGPWAVNFPNLPQGTRDVQPFHELAKRLLVPKGKDRRGPFRWVPWPVAAMHAPFHETRPTVKVLIALARQTMRDYERHKAGEGLLDFADLELHVRRLLCNPRSDLRQRFQEVFVDEFQDVNNLQADIVERFAPAHGRFLVGDVKQCIYAFRLSNPEIFRKLVADAQWLKPEEVDEEAPLPQAERCVVPLGVNFRSRRPIIDLVNSLFEELFARAMIGSEYRDVALRFGYEQGLGPDATPHASGRRGCAPVEIHLVECSRAADENGNSDVPGHATQSSGQSHGGEKPRAKASGPEILAAEAQVVAERLHALMDAGFEVYDRERKQWRTFDLNDVAVLLRSPGPTGGPFAQALQAAGIPAVFGIQPFFEREEICDALNLLHILDNAHDDIALAGVLRAPESGFDDADLVRLRLAWPSSHSLLAALRATATGEASAWSGAPGDRALLEDAGCRDLARRCERFLANLDRWRRLAQAGDLAGAVTAACEEGGLFRTAASRESGLERVGNLQQLIALARGYSEERGHSLPGFVRYLAAIEVGGGGPEPVTVGNLAGPAVRILSAHKAKGLEFPIVVLPLLSRSFNFEDVRKKVLIGEEWIGLDHFDPHTYVKSPTIARSLIAEQRRREILDEELRILYVAMTRAVEKLILTATLPRAWETALGELALWRGPVALRDAVLHHVRQPSDWILGALHRRGALERLVEPDAAVMIDATFELTRHTRAAIEARAPEGPPVTRRGPLPEAAKVDEELAVRALPELRRRVSQTYPHAAATRLRGKYWVTEVKRLIDLEREREERELGAELLTRAPTPSSADAALTLDAEAAMARGAEAGTGRGISRPSRDAAGEGRYLHAVLQELDFVTAVPGDAAGGEAVLACARDLAERREMPDSWVTPENLRPILRFLATPLAAEMADARSLEREVSFTLKLRPSELARIWPGAAELEDEEWLLIQGQIDALWQRADGSRALLDFKSDRIRSDAVAGRAATYRPQILLYREAVARIWKAERIDCWIHFLRPGIAARLE